MSFWACEFSYDNVPSSKFNLTISSASGDSGMQDVRASSDIELYTEQIYRRPKVYFYGTSQRPVLEFDIEVTSPIEIDSVTSQVIQTWLFGQTEYKKLQIIQNDMQMVYFNCLLTSPTVLKHGRMIVGYKATVICDAPFAWEFPRTLTFDYTDVVISESYTFYNASDDVGYLYPTVEITMNSTGGNASITNGSDNNRKFEITDLSAGEVITFDNSRGIITSSTGLNRLSLFNKKWLRFVPSNNELLIEGNIGQLSITYQIARKVAT